MNTISAPVGRLQVFLLVVPLALLLGYIMADSGSAQQITYVFLILGLACLPLYLKWHQVFVIGSVFLAMNAFFLPGQPRLWVPLACGSLLLSVLHRVMNPSTRWIGDKGVSWSLGILAAVVLITAVFTGGIGSRALGSDVWGGRRYLTVLGAVVVFFAISCRPVAQSLRSKVASLYVLTGASGVISNMVFLAGPAFSILYLAFPQELASFQLTDAELVRYNGVTWLSLAFMHFLLLRYGLRGILKLEHGWRLVLFLGFLALSFFGGFRSTLIMIVLLLSAHFCFERMFTARYIIATILAVTFLGAFVVGFAERLPFSVQRVLTILPLQLDPRVERDARGTLEWRLEMWRIVTPDVPKYLLFGKGYSYSGTDVMLTQLGYQMGIVRASYEDTLISGHYHNGILTLIIPFGIWGFGAFAAFAVFAFRVLYRNYQNGSIEMQSINTFLLCLYSSRLIFYLFFYGQFELDLVVFTSLVALSIAINNGVCRPVADRPRTAISENAQA